MATQRQRTVARWSGWDAHGSGVSLNDCPFKGQDAELVDAWRQGWQDRNEQMNRIAEAQAAPKAPPQATR